MKNRQLTSLQLVAISTFILLLGDLFAFFAAMAAIRERETQTDTQAGIIIPPRII